MSVSALHVIGIDPGDTTGVCLLTTPVECVLGREKARILKSDFLEFVGPDYEQSLELARYAREVQGMDYKVGPALAIEDWDVDPSFRSTDPAALIPVRIAAQLRLLRRMSQLETRRLLGDATVTLQGRTLAKQTYTDDRLRAAGLYTPGSDHIRDATRQALTLLRRARKSVDFARSCWPEARWPF